jgi:SEC-C motif-containing protein
MQCPCGSNNSFAQCCDLLISKNNSAQSPEQLMRSRYSAYATKHAEYIYKTYAKDSQVSQSIREIKEWAEQTKWLKLVIHSSSTFDTKHCEAILPTVRFSAFYQHQNQYYQLTEKSKFCLEQDQWRYVDGEISQNNELAIPNRNEPCFCGSIKKFKRCCGA